MSRQKIFFLVLLSIGIAISGYFSIRAASSLITFYTLKQTAPAQILQWEVKESKGKFPIKGTYSFQWDNKTWKGETVLSKPWHLNEPAAIHSIQENSKHKWTAWFNPNNPLKSSLERPFPTGLLVRTAICYSILIYFLIIFRKISKIIYN